MHPLVGQALELGFSEDHAAAALVPFAKSQAAGSMRALSAALHGDAFMEYLFNHPAEEFTAAVARPTALKAAGLQQQQQHRSSLKRAAAPTHFKQQSLEGFDSASHSDDKENDDDFLADDDVAVAPKQQIKQPQPRKRLRRSSEAAGTAAPPAVAVATSAVHEDADIAARIQQNRDILLHGDAVDEQPGHADDDDFVQETATAAVAGQPRSSSRQRPDLDCYIQGVSNTRGSAAGTASGVAAAQQLGPGARPAAAAAAGAGSSSRPSSKSSSKHDPSQPSLHSFFGATQRHHQQVLLGKHSTPAQAAAAAGKTRGSNTGSTQPQLSPMDLPKAHSSRTAARTPAAAVAVDGIRSFFTPSSAAAAAPAAAATGRRSFAAAGLQHATITPASNASAHTGIARNKIISRYQQQQQQQQEPGSSSPNPAAAPWYTPLTQSDKTLGKFDLVNLKVFGHKGFRPQQKDIVQQAVAGRDLFVLMPTGGGKSLCYQLPAVICRGVTVVVCPLLSLMQDQVKALCCNPLGGVPTSYLSSQQTAAEAAAVKNELKKGLPTLKLLYVTPEQLVKSDSLRKILQGLAQRGRLARFVIDEAHCVSTWGHDFRPDYKGLSIIRKSFPNTPITAVTATATGRVQSDILSILGITRSVTVHQTSFLRPNLLFKVVPKVRERDEDSDQPLFITKLIQYIQHQMATAPAAAAAAAAAAGGVKIEPGSATANGVCSGIVYCLSRKEAEQLAQLLKDVGNLKVGHYHAGMTPKQRTEVQNAFFSGALSVIVATIAFGMGIDKPDVRFVVHFCMSKSLEGYYQEAGRAGRDGLPAECVLMYSPADRGRIEYMTRMSLRGSKASNKLEAAMAQLDVMRDYAINGQKRCRHEIMLDYFGVAAKDLPSGKCNMSCDVCRGDVVPLNPEEWDHYGEQDIERDDSIDVLDSESEQHPDEPNHHGSDDQQIVISDSSSGSDAEGTGSDNGSSGSSEGEGESGSEGLGEDCSTEAEGDSPQQQQQQQQGLGGFQSARSMQQQRQQRPGGGAVFQSARTVSQQQQQQRSKPQLSRLNAAASHRQQQQQLIEEPDFSGIEQIAAAAVGQAAAGVGIGGSSSRGKVPATSGPAANAFARKKVLANKFSGFVSAAALQEDPDAAAAAAAAGSSGGWRQKRSGANTAAAAAAAAVERGPRVKDPTTALAAELQAADDDSDFA